MTKTMQAIFDMAKDMKEFVNKIQVLIKDSKVSPEVFQVINQTLIDLTEEYNCLQDASLHIGGDAYYASKTKSELSAYVNAQRYDFYRETRAGLAEAKDLWQDNIALLRRCKYDAILVQLANNLTISHSNDTTTQISDKGFFATKDAETQTEQSQEYSSSQTPAM